MHEAARPSRFAPLARGARVLMLATLALIATTVAHAASDPPHDGVWIEQLGPTSSGHRVIVDPVYDRMMLLAYPLEPDWTGSLRLAWMPLHGTPEWKREEMTVPAGISAWDAYQTPVYDPARHRMLIACIDPTGTATEVWAMPLERPYTWSLLTTAGTPPTPRSNFGLALDAARDRLLLHGGLNLSGGRPSDTWALSLSGTPTWSLLAASGPLPPGTVDPTMALDAAGDRLIVPCRAEWATGEGELWALSLGSSPAWTRLDADGDPFRPSMGSAFVVDADHARVLAFDGDALRVRAIPLAGGAWADIDSMPSPERKGASVVPDPTRGRFLVHGGGDPQHGSGPCGDTYAYSTATGWSSVLTHGPRPERRTAAASALDPTRERLLVQGGYATGGVTPGLWALSLADMAWSQVATQGAALDWNYGHVGVYDPLGDRLLHLLGGSSTGDRQVSFATSPPTVAPLGAGGTQPTARSFAAHAFDPVRRRVVVFGGYDSHDMLADLWALDLDPTPLWHPITVAAGSAPEARGGAMMAYDPVRGRVILFGGYSQNGVRLGDTWALEDQAGVETWVRIGEGATAPEGRNDATLDYDPLLDRMVLHGGYRGSPYPDVRFGWDDTWELALSGPGDWRRLDLGGPPPRGRYGHVSAFDLARDRLVVATGTEWGANDVWTLAFDPPVDAVPPPPALTPPSTLALAPLRNPCAGALDVRLALPARGRVSLEVLDVSGRRVRALDPGEREAGGHTVRLLEPGAVAPGLYVVRAHHASRTTTAKVLIVH